MPTTLNPKEHQRLTELHSLLQGGTFSETDVSAALVLLREKSNGGAIMELAHSIAHSERNSGAFFRRVKHNQSLLNDLGKRGGELHGRYIYSGSEFASNVNETFRRHGFDELDSVVTDLIFLCGLSLLQGGSLKGGKTYGELHLVVTSGQFELRARMPIQHKGCTVQASFSVAAVVNRWIPICNPRTHIDATGPVTVKVCRFAPVVNGFKPFEVHFERNPSIEAVELDRLISTDSRLSRVPSGLLFTPGVGEPMLLRYDGAKLTVQGLPEFFRSGSEYEVAMRNYRTQLEACVHDDSNAHWFLVGPKLGLPPDGYHCHWVGQGSATCTRRM